MKNIRFSIVSALGKGKHNNINLNTNGITNFWIRILKLIKKYKDDIDINKPIDGSDFNEGKYLNYNCGLGNIFHINSEGYITPCIGFSDDEFKHGPLYKFSNLDEIELDFFYNKELEDYQLCSECGLRYFCYGGCKAEIFNLQGTIHGCNLTKRKAMVQLLNEKFT